MRLNKYIALSLGISRRKADELISDGLITLNNQPATLGQQVGTGDRVSYQNRTLSLKSFSYVLFNKPLAYVCSRQAQDEKPTIYELLPETYQHLQTAGRLDADSSGLLLLTNDGDFAHRLTHPRFEKTKQYEVELDKPLNSDDREKIESGIMLADGVSRLKLDGDGRKWTVLMSQGRNRQIRRTFSAGGYEVIKLHRTEFGGYRLDNLEPGQIKVVDKR